MRKKSFTYQKIGILGGSFDPVHNGHLKLGRAALKQLGLRKVYFVLSPQSPFKKNQRLTKVSDRLQMLRLAIKKQPGLSVGTWEIKRKGLSYTVTTLRAYKRKHPSHKLFLILGSDVFKSFHRWKNPKQISSLATLVVGRRPGALTISKKEKSVIVLKGVFPKLSSTQIRNKRSLRSVPKKVAQHIRKKRLYEN